MIAVQIDPIEDPYGHFDPRKQPSVDHRVEIALIEEIFTGQRGFVGRFHHWIGEEGRATSVVG